MPDPAYKYYLNPMHNMSGLVQDNHMSMSSYSSIQLSIRTNRQDSVAAEAAVVEAEAAVAAVVLLVVAVVLEEDSSFVLYIDRK
jgi:hypothetical protein